MENIYKERYETFRHLDRLRWQILQIAVATGSAVLAFGDVSTHGSTNWKWAVAGFIFLVLGTAMIRIGHGIKKNSVALQEAAQEIGDKWVPTSTSNTKSLSFWISIFIVICGIVCITITTVNLF